MGGEDKSAPPRPDAMQASPQEDKGAGKEAAHLSGGAEAGGAARRDAIPAGVQGESAVPDTPSSLGASVEKSTSAELKERSTSIVDLTSPSPSRVA